MTVFEKGVITVVACDVRFAVIAIPLALRRVPRNGVYGYRTPRRSRTTGSGTRRTRISGAVVIATIATARYIRSLRA